jgi:DegV family protein with EDD domain
MAKVAVLTDSTSTIPKDTKDALNISVISQVVIWGEETYKDGIEIQPTEFYQRLSTSPTMPTTSQASVADFQKEYDRLHGEGYDILCVLVSSKLSGTINSAVQAKELVPDAKVEIVDSQAAAMALGFQVIEAAKMAQAGEDLAACRARAEKAVQHTGVILTPETLEFLHRGGRIGGASRFLATALNIKPILELQDGRIEPLERVRTRKKVLKRLVDLVEERIGGRTPVSISPLHANSPADARELQEMAARLNPVNSVLTEVSPAIGTHTGPGTVGLAYIAGME